MKLVERHIIKKTHQFYQQIDELYWRSQNLYNYANCVIF
jgi:putative transposase